MDIGINTEAVCEQLKEELLDKYNVIFCNIEPKAGACVIDTVIPKTDAEFAIAINADQTYTVVRVHKNSESHVLLEWAIDYLKQRGFTSRPATK